MSQLKIILDGNNIDLIQIIRVLFIEILKNNNINTFFESISHS